MNLAPSEEEVAGKMTHSPFPPTAHAAGPILLDESSVVAYSYLKKGESSFKINLFHYVRSNHLYVHFSTY